MRYNIQMEYRDKLNRNIKLHYVGEFFAELLFIIIVWVAYQNQYLTLAQTSLLAGARFLLMLLLELPTGAFADLAGRKWSIALGQILNTIGLFAIAFFPGAPSLIIGTLIRAVGDSFVSGSSTALIYDSLKEIGQEEKFNKVRSNSFLIIQLSIIISSVIGGYMFEIWKGLPYFAYGISTFIAAIIYIYMQEPKIDTEKFTLQNYILQTKLGFQQLFKNSYVTNLSIFYVLAGGFTWAWQIHFNQIYATSIGYGEVEKGWLFAVIRFVNAFLIIRLLHIERLFSKKNIFLLFPLLMIITSLPAIIPSKIIGTALLFTMTLSSSLRFVTLDKFTNEVFDSKYRATAISSLNMLLSIVFITAVSLFGLLLDHYPAGLVYLIMGILTLIFILPRGIYLSRNHQ